MESGNRKWMVPFFTIWTGQQLSIIGSRAAQFALIWWLTLETGSATVLATASLVAFLPIILLGPFVGALVDRYGRQLVNYFYFQFRLLKVHMGIEESHHHRDLQPGFRWRRANAPIAALTFLIPASRLGVIIR